MRIRGRSMVIDAQKRARLEAAGFRVGTPTEFLELTPDESELIEVRLALSRLLRQVRAQSKLSQSALASRAHTSQPRVAKAETNDATVSIDLMLRALFAAGADRQDVARA